MVEMSVEVLRSVVEKMDRQILVAKLGVPEADRSAMDWVNLAQVWRREGSLALARGAYARALEKGAGEKAAYMEAILNAERPAVARQFEQAWPVPFVCLPNLLPDSVWQELLELTLRSQGAFKEGRIEARHLDASIRKVLTNEIPMNWKLRFKDLILERLPQAIEILGIPSFPLGKVEIGMLCSRNTDFYKPHQDTGALIRNRRVSFVYYYYFEPKNYREGDLLLFDSHVAEEDFSAANFTRLIPTQNHGYFFPSDAFHEVTKVVTGDEAFTSNRFTIVGWVSEKTESFDSLSAS